MKKDTVSIRHPCSLCKHSLPVQLLHFGFTLKYTSCMWNACISVMHLLPNLFIVISYPCCVGLAEPKAWGWVVTGGRGQGRSRGRGGAEDWDPRESGLCSSWVKQSFYYVKAVGGGAGERGGWWCEVPVSDVQSRVRSDWPINVLPGALWLIKGRGSAARFFCQQMEAQLCSLLRHKWIREEVVSGRAVLCHH